MATVATRRKNNNVPRTAKINLTPTGLLMEGDYTHWLHPDAATAGAHCPDEPRDLTGKLM